MTYRDAGVDIEAGAELVERIKPAIRKTNRPEVLGGVGGFGGLIAMPNGYRQPVMVAGTDGVGTKLRLAIDSGRHDGVGQDLVAMCVNDILVQGAEPLFFLDYYATAKLELDVATAVINGIAKGCEIAGCALIGGETAEMPGMYAKKDYDLAGFTVGVVERDKIIDGRTQRKGDVLLGLGSSGPHSNGYSLIRKLLALKDTPLSKKVDGQTLGDLLLAPTRIYVKALLPAIRDEKIKAMAHITGGGISENIPRVLQDNLAAEIDLDSWALPPVFQWLRKAGNVADEEMLRTFNCGIGMTISVAAEQAEMLADDLRSAGETVHRIGELVTRGDGEAVRYNGSL